MAQLELSNDILTIDGKESSDRIDNLLATTPIGSIDSVLGNTFYGVNHRLMPNAIPINKDNFGMTFFTRPAMNMQKSNLRNHRLMTPLMTLNNQSIPRIIRMLFDYRLVRHESLTCPFVDNQQAFIPILTDTLLSMNGWPDIEAPRFTSQEGVYKESYSFVDGITQNYSTYNIQASFRNILGDPITMMFFYWLHYMSLVYQGELIPYPEDILENRIDYQTRIYRLVLDSTRTKVQKIAACGAAFPYAVSIGAAFNFEHDRPLNSANDQITVPFTCIGAMYQDDILIYEFNKTVELFNAGMGDKLRNSTYQKIPNDLLILFNHRGYPRINPSNYELEWWISKEDYNRTTAILK